MSTVTTTNTANGTTYTGSAASLTDGSRTVLKQQEMGQMDFLRLLTAQLQTQDPFEPMDNSQMVAQMATITNASGIAEMNASLKTIKDSLSSTRLGDAASWIGRSMLVKSNIATPDAAGQYIGQFSLAEAAQNATLEFVDGSGNVLHSVEYASLQKGETSFYWDGKDAAGNVVATGPVQVKLRGATPTNVATWTTIAAVQSPADGTASKLITPLGSYSPSDAIKLA